MADAWFFLSGVVVGGLAVFLITNTILKAPAETKKESGEESE